MRHYGHMVTAAQVIADREADHQPAPEFFVDYVDTETRKCYGIRNLTLSEIDLTRPCGAWGARTVTLTEPILIQRGHREMVLMATKRKPVSVTETLQLT